MNIDQAIERMQRLVDSGWTCPIPLMTDGLNMDSVGGRKAPPDVVDKHFLMLSRWVQLTGQITLRAQWFHPDQPDWVNRPLARLLDLANFGGDRVDHAFQPFGPKSTPAAFS